MKINFDIYTAIPQIERQVRIHHVEICDEDILELAEKKFGENPPTCFESDKRYIEKIIIDNINI